MTRLPRIRAAVVAGTGAGASLAAAALCILALGTATVSFISRGTSEVVEPNPVALLAALPRPDPAPSRDRPRRVAEPPAVESSPPRPTEPSAAPPRRAAPRRPVLSTRQRRARPVLPPASTTPEPQPAPPPPLPPAPEPPPTLVRGHVEEAAATVRSLGSETPAEPVTELAASTVEDVAQRLP